MQNTTRIDSGTVQVRCASCSALHTVRLTAEQEQRWRDGAYIQNVAPELSPANRELLISGTCSTCWDALFVDQDEENHA